MLIRYGKATADFSINKVFRTWFSCLCFGIKYYLRHPVVCCMVSVAPAAASIGPMWYLPTPCVSWVPQSISNSIDAGVQASKWSPLFSGALDS